MSAAIERPKLSGIHTLHATYHRSNGDRIQAIPNINLVRRHIFKGWAGDGIEERSVRICLGGRDLIRRPAGHEVLPRRVKVTRARNLPRRAPSHAGAKFAEGGAGIAA